MRIFLESLGCKLNQAELEFLGRQLEEAGHSLVGSLSDAEMHVLNTCSVTHIADRDSRKSARRGKRLDPNLRTVLTGCYVTGRPAEAAALAGVDLVVPNSEKGRLMEHLTARFPEMNEAAFCAAPIPVPYVPLEFGNSRAMVKVEDGCNMRCSFCVIPHLRGRQQSRPTSEVVQEVARLAGAGYQEAVVTGVQISSYRWQSAGLFELTRTLLRQTDIPRIRLTSIAPWQFDHRLLDLFSSARLCRHFHLSLQSGSCRTLRRMRRPYSAGDFIDLVDAIRDRIPGIAITTDVIVGFPGETEDEFAESLEFCQRAVFARLHAFPYSARVGTEAASLPDQITPEVKRQRMKRILAVARRSRRQFERDHEHSRAEVLWEHRRKGLWHGLTDNYLRVVTENEEDLAHRITPVQLAARGDFGVIGSVRFNRRRESQGGPLSPL